MKKKTQMNLEIFAHRNIVAEQGEKCSRNFSWNGSEGSIQIAWIPMSLISGCLAADERYIWDVNEYVFVRNKML